MSEKTVKKHPTAFKPGQSGNPKGRPKGARNKTTIALEALLDGEAEEITRKAIEKAKEGDMAAIRLCVERLIPPRKDSPVSFELPEMTNCIDASEAMAGILSAVAKGDITPTEATAISGLVENYRKTLETVELEERLRELEGQN